MVLGSLLSLWVCLCESSQKSMFLYTCKCLEGHIFIFYLSISSFQHMLSECILNVTMIYTWLCGHGHK